MENIIGQIIATYPTSIITVNFANGGSTSGRPFAVFEDGVFQLTNAAGDITDRINICSIAFISLTGTDTFNGFTFLPAPDPLPTGCGAECEAAVRDTLQSFVGGDNVIVFAGGSTTGGSKPVTATAFGVAILNNQVAVSTCAVENITGGGAGIGVLGGSGYVYQLATGADFILAGGADLSFSNNGHLANITHNAGTTTVIINTTGIYSIYYALSITSGIGAQIAIAINGNVDLSTVIPVLSNTGQFSGRAILSLTAGDIITLRNTSGVALTMASAPAVGAQLVIVGLEY